MQVNPLRRRLLRCAVLSLCFTLTSMGPGSGMAADVQLQSGASYKIVRTVYLMAVYESMDDKRVGKGAVRAYLQPERYAKTRWVAFQCEVPAGTVMRIVRPAPPAKDLLRRYDAYYVCLQPNPSRQLDVIVQLFRGFDDSSGGLSPAFFERMGSASDVVPSGISTCTDAK